MAVPDAQEAGKPARASCAHVTFGEQPACCEATPEVQRDDETPWWMRPTVKGSKLAQAVAGIKGHLTLAAFKLRWGKEAYEDHLAAIEQASLSAHPSTLNGKGHDSPRPSLVEDLQEVFAGAEHSHVSEDPIPEKLKKMHLARHPDALGEWRFNPGFTRWKELRLAYDFAFEEVEGRRVPIWKSGWPVCGGLTPVRLMACLMWMDEWKTQTKQTDLPTNEWPVVPSMKFFQMRLSKQQRDPQKQAKYEREAWVLDRGTMRKAAICTDQPLEEIVDKFVQANPTLGWKRDILYQQCKMVLLGVGGPRAMMQRPPEPAPPRREQYDSLRCKIARAFGGDPEWDALYKKYGRGRMFLRKVV